MVCRVDLPACLDSFGQSGSRPDEISTSRCCLLNKVCVMLHQRAMSGEFLELAHGQRQTKQDSETLKL